MNSVLVASNRGPVSFTVSEDGVLTMKRGGGGLVSGLSGVTKNVGVLWVCAALSDGDRSAVRQTPGGRLDQAGYDTGALRMLDIPPATFHRAYNAVANSTLWFVNHLLYDIPNSPRFGTRFQREWESYRDYNGAFALALAEEAGHEARVMVQDYHLTLTPAMLRAERPDLRIAHFSHTPWAPPEYFSLLPDEVAREVLEGILGADHAGFLTERWAGAFMDCCRFLLGAEIDRAGRTITHEGRTTRIGVHPLGVDGAALRDRAGEPDVESHMTALREQVGDRRLIVRIDRTELSKNIVRGLLAYREFLAAHPEWHGRVVHLAFAYPSRHDLPEYREYTASVQRCAQEIEDEYATEDWDPLILNVDDDYPRSLAAYRMADVLLVNPIRDGMNLVAKEGPILSPTAALVLSREAGAAAELGDDALLVNPYDVSGTAAALHEALVMPVEERERRRDRLAAAATALPPQQWLAAQLDALNYDLR
ncbi:alpha,alpha-trehalose-phosphate synthase (UDP-forming) [Nonomuraea cavernae]|uniref:Trehalose-6-phosphate synthase n=1 Tax=Nonomuraea cavernae TaxID=2045107 RepID=A0A918DV14_9ACTN|nr:trehalose-6-phosphate synthase [Nonomuraea cavernae]MCA2190904.1 trehalose-6-phosphate synthase [Nonomuraea cavernae]GGO83144.1 trehalose-6-phosphate synthase [Nonomuraea cavernae]